MLLFSFFITYHSTKMNNMNTTKKFIIIAEPGSVVEDINSENSIFISEDELCNMLEHLQ